MLFFKSIIMLIVISIMTTMSTISMSESVDSQEAIASVVISSTTISRQEARWIYTLKTRYWYDGHKITIYHLPFDNPIHISFVKEVLEMQPSQYLKQVQININAGNAGNIKEVKSVEAMFDQVSKRDGAIGYISKDFLIVNGIDNVNIIKIID
jgi:ABC-type phosphate transport system substrate-binding protein